MAIDAKNYIPALGSLGWSLSIDWSETITTDMTCNWNTTLWDAGWDTLTITWVTSITWAVTVSWLITATWGATIGWALIQGWTWAITSTSWAWAVAVTGQIHEVTTTWTWDAMTLANWTAGQRLTILYVAEWAWGDTAVITPTTLAGGSTITLNNLWDSADIQYSATWGWYVLGLWWAAAVA